MYRRGSGSASRGRLFPQSRPRLFDDDINVFDLEAYMHSGPRDEPSSGHAQASISPDVASNPSASAEQRQDKINPESSKDVSGHPAWADLKTKAGKDRKRLPLACIACRRKKIRCSGEKPACRHCLKSRIPCVYKVTTKKATPRTDYMAMLDKRLKRMEERVIRIIPKHAEKPSIPRAILRPSASSSHALQQQSRKRPATEAFGTDLDAWVLSAGADRDPRKHIDPRAADPDEARLLAEGVESLPSTELQDHLVEVYFDFIYGQSYYLLHKPSFTRMRSIGKVPPVLLLAVCAVSARFSDHPELQTEPTFLRGDSWARAAQSIVSKRIDNPNVTILTVLLLLALHTFGTCQGGRSWMLAGIAHRMAYALELHKELEFDPLSSRAGQKVPLSTLDREIRRRTMWACFVMDRFNSSGTERPMFANETYLKIQLPLREDLFQMELAGQTEMLDGGKPPLNNKTQANGTLQSGNNIGVAAFVVRVIALWGRLVQYWNLGGHEREVHPIWHTESGYAVIASQVQDFEKGLPESMQYNSGNLSMHAAEGVGNQFLFLHIAAHQAKLFLHRFAFPATWPRKPPADMPSEFLLRARETTMSAASAISRLVEQAADHNVVVPFAGYSAYLSGAVHVHVIFANPNGLGPESRTLLTHNVKYLTRMKKHWGMFYFLTESLKELYRQYADAAGKGTLNPETRPGPKRVFQYGDWYDRYPRGVSRTHYEEPAAKDQPKNEAVLSQKSDLQSVEEFFASHPQLPSKGSGSHKRARARATKSENARSGLGSKFTTKNSSSNASALADTAGVDRLTRSGHEDASPHNGDRDPSSATRFSHAPSVLVQDTNVLQPGNLSEQAPVLATDRIDTTSSSTDTHGIDLNMLPDINTESTMIEEMWDVDLSSFGADAFGEAANAWYVPFNVNLPDSMDDQDQLDHAADIAETYNGGRELP